MATADELLASAAESDVEILEVDLNARVISIPATLRVLGVESDDDVKRLQFKVPRYYGEFDLSTFDIRVNFENAKRGGDFYLVDDLEVSDDSKFITFSWLVDRTAFAYPGDVKFSICMRLLGAQGVILKELNTTYATLPVLEGLETEKAVVDNNPTAFSTVLHRLYAVEAATGNGQNGYYSVIKVSTDDNGVQFTVVNQTGETVAYVRHGTDGVDGHTPVKGVDYWTQEDEVEILQEVSNYNKQQLNSWAPRSTTVTLSAQEWVDNQQTETAECVTHNNIVIIAPDPDYNNSIEYSRCKVRCVAQGNGELTFECAETPSINLVVNVAIYYSGEVVENSGGMTVTDDDKGNVTIIC